MLRLFLTYADSDDRLLLERIRERLETGFGASNIVTSAGVTTGVDNPDEALRNAVIRCDAVLVVIGNGWMRDSDTRLQSPDGAEHIPLRYGLDNEKIRVIPVLIDGAEMPTPADLPAALRGLAALNAHQVRGADTFEQDMDLLVEQVNKIGVGQISGVRAMFHDMDDMAETLPQKPSPVNLPLPVWIALGIGAMLLIGVILVLVLGG